MADEAFFRLKLEKFTRAKSIVWQHFGFRDSNKDNCICIHCNTSLKNNGNTTNLRNHLSAKHRQVYNDMAQTERDRDKEDSESMLSAPEQDFSALSPTSRTSNQGSSGKIFLLNHFKNNNAFLIVG